MISREQIKAARAMLDWSQNDLAGHCGTVSTPTVKLIETGKINSTPETLGALQKTLEDAGLEFIPQNGVRFRDDLVSIIEGQNSTNIFLRLLDDIYYTVKRTGGGEVLWSFSDESLSPPEVIAREKMIREAGASFRNLIRFHDRSFHYDIDEYRWLPKGFFLHNITVIYGDKFATIVKKANENDVAKIIVINDRSIAEMKRMEFDIIWKYSTNPDGTDGS